MKDISLIRFLPDEPRIPFMKFRYVALLISIIGVVLSLLDFAARGLNYGLDFKGGTVWEFHLQESPDNKVLDSLRGLGPELGLGELAIQSINQAGEGKVEAIRLSIPKQDKLEGDDTDDRAQQMALKKVQEAINEKYGWEQNGAKQVTTLSVQSLGTKVSSELKTKGVLAVALALFFVLLYIWFRFEWQFGAGAVLALFHDVSLTIGVFALTGLEFNLSIVAAILTIVGYSLNDTVIVYDRIRENMRKFKQMPLIELLNRSINETLSRTIMTSLTTMLALVALYIWGGPGLHNFAFAMIWGVFVGTYSSIFVAAPLLLLLKVKRGGMVGKQEKEVAKA